MRPLLLFALCLLVVFRAPATPAEKPNVVLILADDLGISDLSCYGRRDQTTPNLDRLAREGMRFTCAYCAQPICSPSRAALLTGRAPARLHLTTFLPGRSDAPSQKLLHPVIQQQLPLEEQTLAELLHPQGYVSACIGKWHLGGAGFGPLQQGFDVAFTGHANSLPSATEGGKGEYELTAHALEFLETNRERPFFLYLAHNSPHVPLGAKPELIAKYASSFNPVYAAMMETLDDSIGQVLRKLEELHLTEKTLVIFTSDNGGLHVPELPETPATTNAPFRAGKGYLYEGGLREPLLVRWPGHIAPGSESSTPVVLADLMPTLLELAGAPRPENLDYTSLAPVLLGQGELAPRDLFFHFPHYTNQGGRPGGAIRSGPWKLLEHYEDGRAELFDLEKDVAETTELSGQFPAVVAELRGKLAAWRREVGAQENTPNPAFEAALARPLYGTVDTTKLAPAPTAAVLREQLGSWRAAMDEVLRKAVPGARTTPSGQVGFLVLPASQATVHGTNLRYEPKPQKNTLGFWTKVEDWASWDFELPAAGKYAVEVLTGCGKGSGGALVEVKGGGESLEFKVPETGHFQNFVPRTIGALPFTAGRNTLSVVPKAKTGAAVMDLRQVTLTLME